MHIPIAFQFPYHRFFDVHIQFVCDLILFLILSGFDEKCAHEEFPFQNWFTYTIVRYRAFKSLTLTDTENHFCCSLTWLCLHCKICTCSIWLFFFHLHPLLLLLLLLLAWRCINSMHIRIITINFLPQSIKWMIYLHRATFFRILIVMKRNQKKKHEINCSLLWSRSFWLCIVEWKQKFKIKNTQLKYTRNTLNIILGLILAPVMSVN